MKNQMVVATTAHSTTSIMRLCVDACVCVCATHTRRVFICLSVHPSIMPRFMLREQVLQLGERP